VLAPIGGTQLSALRVPGDLAPAPLGAALTADGVLVRWATAGSAETLAASFAAAGTRWSSPDGQLWKIGETIAVVAGDRVAIVSAGAPSTRERTALAVAARGLRIDSPPTPRGLSIEVDAATLVELLLDDPPGELLAQVATDLGRITASVLAAPDRVTLEVAVAPAPGTLAERMLAGAHGVGAPIARGAVILSTNLTPEDAAQVLTAVGAREGLNVTHALGERGPSILTGQVSLGPGGVGLRVTDEAIQLQFASGALTVAPNGLVYGRTGATRGAGLNVSIESLAPIPLPPIDAPSVGPIADENTDVPWSQEYREARRAFDAKDRAVDAAVIALRSATGVAEQRWATVFGHALHVPFTRTASGFHGRGDWIPPAGTIAATAAAAAAELADLDALRANVTTAHAAAVAARQTAIEIRARDVAAWDRAHP
jgi:hypothetical protein